MSASPVKQKLLRVGKLPWYRRPAIYVENGSLIEVLGWFKGDAEMQEFLSFNPQFTPTGATDAQQPP